MERYGYLLIDLPDELVIPIQDNSRVRAFETKCGENLSGFTNDAISCVVKSSGR